MKIKFLDTFLRLRFAAYPKCSLSDESKLLALDNVHIFVYFIVMKTISFYRTASGKCPVRNHLDTLTDVQATKVAWVLKLIREIDQVPSKYFKKLVNANDIWEVRIDVGKDTFRLLGFFNDQEIIILTNSFQKKSQKTPTKEIRLAENRKKEYLSRRQTDG
jgi:phage-related protein